MNPQKQAYEITVFIVLYRDGQNTFQVVITKYKIGKYTFEKRSELYIRIELMTLYY